jgi:hypothetical protein
MELFLVRCRRASEAAADNTADHCTDRGGGRSSVAVADLVADSGADYRTADRAERIGAVVARLAIGGFVGGSP